MNNNYAVMRYEQAASLLPTRWQRIALQVPEWEKVQAEELRLRTGRPMTVLLTEGEVIAQSERPYQLVTQSDLEQLCDTVTGYSRYAVCDTMSKGYLTAVGGYRVGLCGTAVMQGGAVTNLRDFSSAVIRIGREISGIAEEILPMLWAGEHLCSTLICSPPGGGKTTLLRDMVRGLSDGTKTRPACRIALVDERGELAAMHLGQAQMSVGCHTDVLDGCPKALAIPILLRAANPQIIAVDEITQPGDLQAMIHAANCGVSLLATIHAGSSEELQRKSVYQQLSDSGVFEKVVWIRCRSGRREYEVQEL